MNSFLNNLRKFLIKSLLKSLIKDKKELKDILDDIDKKSSKRSKVKNWNNLTLIAQKMIDNAKNGILIDLEEKIIKDFNFDLQRMQIVFDKIEYKRTHKQKEGPSKHINISANDIKAVLFKPIVKLPLQNDSIILKGSWLKKLWEFTTISLNENLEKLTWNKLQEAFNYTKDNIISFERFILSKLNNDEDFKEFIEVILEEIPTAFGEPSL